MTPVLVRRTREYTKKTMHCTLQMGELCGDSCISVKLLRTHSASRRGSMLAHRPTKAGSGPSSFVEEEEKMGKGVGRSWKQGDRPAQGDTGLSRDRFSL